MLVVPVGGGTLDDSEVEVVSELVDELGTGEDSVPLLEDGEEELRVDTKVEVEVDGVKIVVPLLVTGTLLVTGVVSVVTMGVVSGVVLGTGDGVLLGGLVDPVEGVPGGAEDDGGGTEVEERGVTTGVQDCG